VPREGCPGAGRAGRDDEKRMSEMTKITTIKTRRRAIHRLSPNSITPTSPKLPRPGKFRGSRRDGIWAKGNVTVFFADLSRTSRGSRHSGIWALVNRRTCVYIVGAKHHVYLRRPRIDLPLYLLPAVHCSATTDVDKSSTYTAGAGSKTGTATPSCWTRKLAFHVYSPGVVRVGRSRRGYC